MIQDFQGVIERYAIALRAGKGDFVIPVGCELFLYITNSSLPSGQPVTEAVIGFNDDFEPEPAKVVVRESSASLEMFFPMSAVNTYLSVLDSGKPMDFDALLNQTGDGSFDSISTPDFPRTQSPGYRLTLDRLRGIRMPLRDCARRSR